MTCAMHVSGHLTSQLISNILSQNLMYLYGSAIVWWGRLKTNNFSIYQLIVCILEVKRLRLCSWASGLPLVHSSK